MNKEVLKIYKDIIYADKVFDVNFKNVSKVLFKEIERLNNIINTLFDRFTINEENLNIEIEIIEEDKKIEHLLNGVDFENLKDNEKFDYLYEMETRIINYLEENK